MKTLLAGIVLIIILGVGGFLYRAEMENRSQTVACPLDAKVCPDGTAVGRIGLSCTFPACPPPNVSIDSLNISFALPEGYATMALPDAASVAAYSKDNSASSTDESDIIIRDYAIDASSTAISVIQASAIGDVSGAPVPVTDYSSTQIGTHRFTVVSLGRYEGVVHTAYYLTRGTDVLRFDAIDRGITDWSDPNLDVSSLPATIDLHYLLGTLQGI
jgi:hypothetical protein